MLTFRGPILGHVLGHGRPRKVLRVPERDLGNSVRMLSVLTGASVRTYSGTRFWAVFDSFGVFQAARSISVGPKYDLVRHGFGNDRARRPDVHDAGR